MTVSSKPEPAQLRKRPPLALPPRENAARPSTFVRYVPAPILPQASTLPCDIFLCSSPRPSRSTADLAKICATFASSFRTRSSPHMYCFCRR